MQKCKSAIAICFLAMLTFTTALLFTRADRAAERETHENNVMLHRMVDELARRQGVPTSQP